MLAFFTGSGIRAVGVSVAMAMVLVVSGCGKKGSGPVATVPLDHYREVEDFSFTNQQGETVTRAALLGKVWVANFVFTSCATECVMLSQKMAGLQNRYPNREDVAFASFSVDPQTDNPERLAGYAKRWGADNARWQFFTGDPETLDAIIKQSFLLPVMRTPEEQASLIRTNFIHSNKLAIVDRQGVVRAYVEGLEPDAIDQAVKVIDVLLAEPVPVPAS